MPNPIWVECARCGYEFEYVENEDAPPICPQCYLEGATITHEEIKEEE